MTIDEIKGLIMSDTANCEFTEKGWQPIFQGDEEAKILIIGQAPGIKTQEVGEPFHDKSGERLRGWLGIDEAIFYESKKIAILPLDFYFPGKGKTGDLPPRLTFADKWHPKIIERMPKIELVILIGGYAQKYYLKEKMKSNLTQTV